MTGMDQSAGLRDLTDILLINLSVEAYLAAKPK